MENNNETQKSTEQLYSSIEGSSLELEKKVDEEPSYSLEDLHPEDKEEIKPVAPAASHAEEIQPDPTVIDGKKETIGDQSAINEMPTINHVEPPKPAPAPVQLKDPAPVQQLPRQQIKKQQIPEEPSPKVFYAIFAVILIVVLVGLPLYTVINNSLDSNKGTGEPIEQKEQEQEETKPEEKPIVEQPSKKPGQINFDMTLSFDKGFVVNEKEINQKVGYLPTNINGVIRCDLEKPMVMGGITTYASTYLHYEDYKLRSAITVTKQVYNDEATYMNTKDATDVYKTAGDKYETLDVEITKDDATFTVTNTMHYHLIYGHSTFIDDLNTHIMFSSPYSTNIKTAIEKALTTGMNNGNAVCGTLNTENATS